MKITDFGIALRRVVRADHAGGSDLGVGRPPTWPRNVSRAARPPRPATCTRWAWSAYQCLTGEVPFGGIPPEVTAAHQHRTLPPLPRTVPAGVAGLILELTAKDPAARPASAGEVTVRAGQLRDALASEPPDTATDAGRPCWPVSRPLWPGKRSPWPVCPAAVAAPAHRPLLWDRMRPRRGVVLAVAGAAVAAGLAGWLLAGAFGAGSPQPSPGGGAAPPATGKSSAPATHTVEVNAGTLAGQRASAVTHRLRQLGLRPRVVGAVRGGQAPGTVISVQPSGQVPAGSMVTVIAAVQPPGHGNGNGQGNDGGD